MWGNIKALYIDNKISFGKMICNFFIIIINIFVFMYLE